MYYNLLPVRELLLAIRVLDSAGTNVPSVVEKSRAFESCPPCPHRPRVCLAQARLRSHIKYCNVSLSASTREQGRVAYRYL
jgi:hypothetical protein